MSPFLFAPAVPIPKKAEYSQLSRTRICQINLSTTQPLHEILLSHLYPSNLNRSASFTLQKYLEFAFFFSFSTPYSSASLSTSTKRPLSHAIFAVLRSASNSPLVSHIPLNTASSPVFFNN